MGTITSETIFKDYPKQILKEYVKIINNGTDELYTNFPKVEDEGTKLELDTEKGPLRMILKGNTSQITNILPEEYTQVDYIESSGTQYIDTGVKPNQDTKVDIKLYSLSTNIYFNVPFGARVGDTEQFFIGLQTNSNQHWFLRYGTLTNLSKYGVKYGYNHIVFNKNEVYFNNELAYSFNQQTFQNPYNIYLFACNIDGTVDRNFYGYIYSCQIYDNDVLIRDLVPCIRNSDNEVGMYDLVTDTFYINQGTGVFTYGSVVQIPNSDYPQDIKVATGEQKIIINNKNQFYSPDRYISGRGINLYIEQNNHIRIVGTTSNTYYQVTATAKDIIKNDNWKYSFSFSEPLIVLNKNVPHIFSLQNLNYTNYICAVDIFTDNDTRITVALNSQTNIRQAIIPAGEDIYAISFRFSNSRAYTGDFDIQLEEGNVFTSYVKNQRQKYNIDLSNIELAKIGNYKDYIFKNELSSPYYSADLDLNGWYYSNLFTKINSYNEEIVTTPYISTTGGLDIGATIYYYNNSNAPVKITDTTLISQLENINNSVHSYKETTIIECSSSVDDNETIQVSTTALKNIN